MDYPAAIERVYAHLEEDRVDKATMACLRIARHLPDHLYAAIFLREVFPLEKDFARTLLDDTDHLKREAQRFLRDKSLEYWLETHTLDFSIFTDDDGEEKNVLRVAVGELDPELEQCEFWIRDRAVPPGMDQDDTAAFAHRYASDTSQMRLRIKALHTIKQRIAARCLNYAIRIERQLQAQVKPRSFLFAVQTEANNYFNAHAEVVYEKLKKAVELADSNDSEVHFLLLTQVRRAIKALADHFYPPVAGEVKCADGRMRKLGNDEYLNRLEEYLKTTFTASSSRDLLTAEFDRLAVFARRLNDVASKGVHTDATSNEAKQGLIGLYLLLFNIVVRLQERANDNE